MRAEELMLDDWVSFTTTYLSGIGKIIGIEPREGIGAKGSTFTILFVKDGQNIVHVGARAVNVTPVPLTKEILEKNGFCHFANLGKFCLFDEESYSHQQVIIELCKVESVNSTQLYIYEQYRPKNMLLKKMDCDFVHELQHALRLCGIEKEIEL